MTKDELRRAFPKASYWWIELWTAFDREGISTIEIDTRRVGLEVLHKLFPTLYPHTAKHKAGARAALNEAIKPRRNGGKRGRPSLAPVLADIEACREGTNYFDEERLAAVVLAHLKPANRSERLAVLRSLDASIERQGGRVDWREWLRTMRQTLKKSDAE